MRTPTSICVLALAIVAPILGPACGEGGPSGPDPVATATVTGFVTSPTGAGVAGASVSIGGASATTNAVGQYRLEDQPVGGATIVTSAPGYASRSDDISLVAGLNDHGVVLTPLTQFGSEYCT